MSHESSSAPTMSPRQLEIMQHCWGADEYGRRKKFSERNYFCAGLKDEEDCRALIAIGYMREHKRTEWLPYLNCSCTDAGVMAMNRESPAPPKLTRSQQRYRRFLSDDLDISFREWLKEYDHD
jgi:hypothetical protein